MPMYALYQRDEDEAALAKEVGRSLGGNLCRYTSYRPMKQAASRALSMRAADRLMTSNWYCNRYYSIMHLL